MKQANISLHADCRCSDQKNLKMIIDDTRWMGFSETKFHDIYMYTTRIESLCDFTPHSSGLKNKSLQKYAEVRLS